MLQKIINYLEKNLIVKTMYVMLDSIFCRNFITYKFEVKEEEKKFIIKIEATEELGNKRIITNTKLETKSFIDLIINKEEIESRLRERLLGEKIEGEGRC